MKTKILCLLLSISLFFGSYGNLIAQSTTTIPFFALKMAQGMSETSFRAIVSFAEKSAVKRKIELYFEDVPEMSQIADCESGFRQFDSDGKPLRSPTGDFGALQINKKVWHKKSIELGYDYQNNLDDNLRMARHVYEVQGISAWVCSKKLSLI